MRRCEAKRKNDEWQKTAISGEKEGLVGTQIWTLLQHYVKTKSALSRGGNIGHDTTTRLENDTELAGLGLL